MRPKSLAYILYNANDLAVAGMSEQVKELCRNSQICSKKYLRSQFVGDYSSELQDNTPGCCRICDRGQEE